MNIDITNIKKFRERLDRKGITMTQWAAERGFKKSVVLSVANGRSKGRYGEAHDVAVAMGLKNTTERSRA